MKPAPFEFIAPGTLEEALSTLDSYGYEAKILAGGQSLIPAMNFRLMQPGVLIDLNRIPSLSYIHKTETGGVRIGAMTRQRMVERSSDIAALAPLLHEAMPQIAHPQIRNRGTIGGSLAHADPAAELPVVAFALDAKFHIQSASGKRTLEAPEFFQFMFSTDLAPNEILTEVEFPAFPERTGWAFEEFARRQGDYAMAGVAATLTVDENGICTHAKLVFLNLGEGPLVGVSSQVLLIGSPPTTEAFQAAGAEAAKEVDPSGNVHATPAYQRHLASVLTERALKRAASRLNGSFKHA